MIRTVFACAVLAACGAATKPTPVPRDTLGSSTHDTPHTGGEPATMVQPDAALAARLAYSDPGGMWMPQQIALPQLADTLHSLGVALDAKQLGDPLGEPLA